MWCGVVLCEVSVGSCEAPALKQPGLCCCVVVLWCCVVCVCCVAWVLVSRFHGVGSHGCWFQGLVWTALPGTAPQWPKTIYCLFEAVRQFVFCRSEESERSRSRLWQLSQPTGQKSNSERSGEQFKPRHKSSHTWATNGESVASHADVDPSQGRQSDLQRTRGTSRFWN